MEPKVPSIRDRQDRDVAVRKSAPALSVGRIILKTGTIQVEVDGQAVKVTGAEFRVLETLMKSAGQVFRKHGAQLDIVVDDQQFWLTSQFIDTRP